MSSPLRKHQPVDDVAERRRGPRGPPSPRPRRPRRRHASPCRTTGDLAGDLAVRHADVGEDHLVAVLRAARSTAGFTRSCFSTSTPSLLERLADGHRQDAVRSRAFFSPILTWTVLGVTTSTARPSRPMVALRLLDRRAPPYDWPSSPKASETSVEVTQWVCSSPSTGQRQRPAVLHVDPAAVGDGLVEVGGDQVVIADLDALRLQHVPEHVSAIALTSRSLPSTEHRHRGAERSVAERTAGDGRGPRRTTGPPGRSCCG